MAYDLVVIGGGPGGYVAAIRAAQLGARVALVERDQLGGTCLNRGCIPTKTLLASAQRLEEVRHAGEFGIQVGEITVDYAAIVRRKQEVVAKLVKGIGFLLQRNKVEVIRGTGQIQAPDLVTVEQEEGSQQLRTRGTILATGSEPALIAALGYDGQNVLTSNEALELTTIPTSLLIIGGGVIGCELATVFAILGAEVTIMEAMPNVLPMLDKELARKQQSLLKRRGINIYPKTKIEAVQVTGSGVAATLDNGQVIETAKAVISIGRQLNTRGLGLEQCGIVLGNRGEVQVDEFMQTNVPGIYAIGDITNKVQLAHVASAQGIVAAEHFMQHARPMDYRVIPSCIFTLPEIGSVGLSQEEAQSQGLEFRVGKFPWTASGKAQGMGETEGVAKVIARVDNDQILGAHIIGPHATDLVAEAALAMATGVTATGWAQVIHAHPTLAEGLAEAAEAIHGQSIHA